MKTEEGEAIDRVPAQSAATKAAAASEPSADAAETPDGRALFAHIYQDLFGDYGLDVRYENG